MCFLGTLVFIYFIQVLSKLEFLLFFIPSVFPVCHNCLSQNLELAILNHATSCILITVSVVDDS